jgi:FkbM family methyltransferase
VRRATVSRLPKPPLVHAAARRLGAAGVPGVRLYWPLAERLAAWPTAEHLEVGDAVPVVITSRDDFVGANVYRGLFERSEVRVFPHLLRPGDLFVDVGANLGYYTAMGSRLVGPSGRVLAFEPSPVCFPRLERLVAVGGLDNVRVFRAAVGAAEGTSTLYNAADADNSGAATLRPDLGGDDVGVEVRVLRLDDVPELAKADSVALLKVDTEGFEEQVLEGATALFDEARVRFAIIEITRQFGPTDFAADHLARHPAYQAFAISEAGLPRRTRLRPLTPADISSASQQFNMLLARTDAVPAVSHFIRRH